MAAARRISLRAALQRSAAASRNRIAARRLHQQAARASLQAEWRRCILRTRAGAAERARRAQQHTLGACLFSRAASLQCMQAWEHHAIAMRTMRDATSAIAARERRRQAGEAVSQWQAWLRRRAAWRRCALRRAIAHNGWLRFHLPCMRAFDGRAIFVEEGSAAMANAYRRRRVAAVIFCRWLVVASGGVTSTALDAGEAAVEAVAG